MHLTNPKAITTQRTHKSLQSFSQTWYDFCYTHPFTRNLTNNVTDWSTVYRSKTCKVPQDPCERKAEPCKFFSVQKLVWTRVNWVTDNNFCTNKLYWWSKITCLKLSSIIFLPWRSPTCFNTEQGKWGRTFKFQPILKKKKEKEMFLELQILLQNVYFQ